MKQETLEEVADLWSIDTNNVHPADSYIAKQGFIAGAKWQAENMFSEEETKLIEGLINLYWTEHNSEHPANLKVFEASKSILEKLKNK